MIFLFHYLVKVTIRPGFSRTVLYFWVLSWMSRCPGFVLDCLLTLHWNFENVYLSQYYVLNVRLLTAMTNRHNDTIVKDR